MKLRLLAILITIMLLSSCTFLPAPMSGTPFPTLTPLAENTGLNTEQQTTATAPAAPTNTSSPVIFRDDFNLLLMSGWNWRGSDPSNISLSEQKGLLRLNANASYAFHDGTASLLIRQAPEQDFVIETRMTFVPNTDSQFAGLVVYESKNAYLQAGRGFCRRSAECAGDGLFLDRFINGSIQTPRLFQPYKDSDTLYLRLERRGSVYRFYASPNDAIWQPIGERHSDITPLYVGLFAGQNNGPVLVPAYFDYFQISQIPSQTTP